jgi:hypothetical protein
MNSRRALGISLAAATVSLALPALLSAQGEVAEPEQPVTVTLLGDGRIRVSGNFTLEMPDAAAAISSRSVVMRDGAGVRIGDFSQGMKVEVQNYIIEAESGAMLIDNGSSRRLQMQDAVISHSR